MDNFIFGALVVVAFGVILYLYLSERAKRDVEQRRVKLNELRKQIDTNSPMYRAQVDAYNDFVLANADILRKYGIDPATIVRQNVVPDVRSGRFVDLNSGQAVTDPTPGGRLASQLPNASPR